MDPHKRKHIVARSNYEVAVLACHSLACKRHVLSAKFKIVASQRLCVDSKLSDIPDEDCQMIEPHTKSHLALSLR